MRILIDWKKKDKDPKSTIRALEQERDLELENIIENLVNAELQLDRLRSRLSEKVAGYGRGVNGYHYKSDKKPVSINTFENNGKLYRISFKVDQLEINSNKLDDNLH